jgi:DNA-binding winged helix-turn-helix (wHTH) protein
MPKQQIEHILTPETEKHLFTDQILPPLLRGESLSIVKVPHSGVRFQMLFLVENFSSFGFNKLQPRFIYIGFNELTGGDPDIFFQQASYLLNPQDYKKEEDANYFFKLKEKVREITDNGSHIIFILGEFNKFNHSTSFFNNLVALWQTGREKMHFIFVTTQDIFNKTHLQRFDQLAQLLTQNIFYFPMLLKEDSMYVADHLDKRYHYQVSKKGKEYSLTLGGGHPVLIKIGLRLASKYPSISFEDLSGLVSRQWETNVIFEDIWISLSEDERKFLHNLARKKLTLLKEVPDFLIKMGIVQKKGELNFFSPLFESFVQSRSISAPVLSIEKDSEEILINGSPIREKITLHEYHLLLEFLKNPERVINRDQIAEALWGKNLYHKYSDWAIDQSISLLRKKIENLGISPKTIQTIKGRGYRWVEK